MGDGIPMRILLLILIVCFCNACAFIVAKETAKVVDIITEDDPNPEKKKKILENKRRNRIKLKSFIVVK